MSHCAVVSSVLCLPHFLEYRSERNLQAEVVLVENRLYQTWHYRLIYISLIDPFIR